MSSTSSFESLGLSPELLLAIQEQGYTEPTQIQKDAIPVILQKNDIMGLAQTGTGKTAAFTLPLLQLLNARTHAEPEARRFIRALILVPTRELAAQVADSVKTYGKHLTLKAEVIFGGVSIVPQISKMKRGTDIVIATPGRLLDLLDQKAVDLSKVEILVLDEADRMLDMGFVHDVKRIIDLLPYKKQSMLFSATLSSEIQVITNSLLKNPTIIEVARRNITTNLVSQIVYPVDRKRKKELLSFMIGSKNWKQVLVFTRTKHGANHLCEQLILDGLTAAAIHGNKSQGARTRALDDFKTGKISILVATDIAARGIDIDQLPFVINFDLPNVAEDYVHRIGRTGRAGNEGAAISLVCVDEIHLLKDIEKLIKAQIVQEIIPGYEPDRSIKAEPIPNGRRAPGGNTGFAKKSGSSSQPARRQDSSDRKSGSNDRYSDRPARSFGAKQIERDGEKKTLNRPFDSSSNEHESVYKPTKSFGARPSELDGDRPTRPFVARTSERDGDRPARPFGARPSGRDGDRPARPFGARPSERDGDKPARSYGARPSERDGDRPARSFGARPSERDGDRPARSFGAKPSGRDGDKPTRFFVARTSERDGDRPTRFFVARTSERDGDRPTRSFGARPSGRDGDKPTRSFGARPSGRDGDKPTKSFGAKPSGRDGDKPTRFGARPSERDGDRPARSFGARPSGRDGDKPTRSFGARPSGRYGDKPTRFFGARPSGRDGDKPTKSFGAKPSGRDGDKPTRFGARPSGRDGDKPTRSFGARPSGRDGDKPTRSFGARPSGRDGDKPTRSFGARPSGRNGDKPTRSFGSSPREDRSSDKD